ncbi:transporter [Thermophilibacter provencensis]|uniref:transporter n=1 Tax=Thermophilibacter provencensis TaxID=1852386 RepID=UPI0023541531|nr:transporter [Thermophilibacter provencensis]
MAATRGRTLLGLHALLALYSLCSICGKLAAGFEFMSPGFILCYGSMILVLGLYAIGWQQVIKRMPLTSAYANKAVTIVWGIVWGVLLFHEAVTPAKLMGAAVVLAGVVLFSIADGEEG